MAYKIEPFGRLKQRVLEEYISKMKIGESFDRDEFMKENWNVKKPDEFSRRSFDAIKCYASKITGVSLKTKKGIVTRLK